MTTSEALNLTANDTLHYLTKANGISQCNYTWEIN